MARGQRILLMNNADLYDMTIAEEEEARKYGSSEAHETIPNTQRIITTMLGEQENTEVGSSAMRFSQPDQHTIASSAKPNLGKSIFTRKRTTSIGELSPNILLI